MNFIAIDWGSTNFRAYRIEAGELTGTINKPLGITQLADKPDFNQLLTSAIAQWREWIASEQVPILMAGMIGSDRGWLDSGYQTLPLSTAAIRQKLLPVNNHLATAIYLRPGLATDSPANVMRGEEVQLLGALELIKADDYLFPGTHSKWVRPEYQSHQTLIQNFRTVITGELYALLMQHSLIGAGTPTAIIPAAFAKGLEQGLKAKESIIEQIFTARARRVMGLSDKTETAGWLSGLLIGYEIGLCAGAGRQVAIIGKPALAQLYVDGLLRIGAKAVLLDDEQAILQGFRSIYNANL